MTTTTRPHAAHFLESLTSIVGPQRMLTESKKIGRYLRDFSWYSPILETALADTTVTAVAKPTSLDELTDIVSLAAQHRIPLTMRGAGTGNYGQSLPLQDGIVVDIKGVGGVLDISEGRVSVLPGTTMKTIEEVARLAGQELAVMPSTYRVATASGFICGGSGGIGAAAHGDMWNGNILSVELMTVEEEPRILRLEGEEVNTVLHTYGTIGVITQVDMRLVPRREYEPVVVVFDSFEDACAFGWDLVDSDIHTRLASLHQAPIGAMMTPLADSFPATAHIALVWSDEEQAQDLRQLAASHHGAVQLWPDSAPHITQFPYSHTILWSRRADPGSSWLQCEYTADDRGRFLEQVAAVTERYPTEFPQHIEINKSHSGGVRCMGIPPIMGLPNHEAALDELLEFCTSLGILVLNPHSFVVEEGGFVGDTSQVAALKAESDPYGILNPGKLGESFFAQRTGVAGAGPVDLSSPEQLDNLS